MSRPRAETIDALVAENALLRAALRALEWKTSHHAAGLLVLGHLDRAKGLTDACAIARAALATTNGAKP